MLTTSNSKFFVPLKKMTIAQDVCACMCFILVLGLALPYGCMLGAAYIGIPVYIGLSIPIAINMYIGWREEFLVFMTIGQPIAIMLVTPRIIYRSGVSPLLW